MADTSPTVGMTTYQQIKHDIIFGVLKPGAKLKLDALTMQPASRPCARH